MDNAMMKNLPIRPYQPGDEKEVIRLWQECHLVAPQNNLAGIILVFSGLALFIHFQEFVK